MATIQVTGIMSSPIEGRPLSNSKIRVVALENYVPVTKKAVAVYDTDNTGFYDFDLYYGTYAVSIMSGTRWESLGKAIANDELEATTDLITLLNASQAPLTPWEIKYIEGLVKEAEDSAIAAKASEDASKLSETNSKLSETNSKLSETNSKASEIASKASEDAAAQSEYNVELIEATLEVASGIQLRTDLINTQRIIAELHPVY